MTDLKSFIETNQISQRELAEGVGISAAGVSWILSGKNNPSKESIDAILTFCRKHDPDVTYEDLFGEPHQKAS